MAPPAAPVVSVLGLSQLDMPLLGGTLVPFPQLLVNGTANTAGAYQLPLTWSSSAAPGTALFAQVWVLDGSAAHGYSASNAMTSVQRP